MKKLTQEEFIEKAKSVHGDKYDYSKVEYINTKAKICIICPEHGEFWQEAASHLRGVGCPECGFINTANKRRIGKEEFIKRAKEIHGDKYDYSKVEYSDMKSKVCIICPVHGEFWQEPLNHLTSHGCNKCGRKHFANNHNKGTENFIEESRKIHGDKYDYSKVEYVNAHTKVCIICPAHGEFWQEPNEHLRNKGCPKCKESSLEKEIRNVLEENNIEYIQECSSSTFKWLGRQKLDFYLPKHNIAIECQGEQHFFKSKYDLYGFEKNAERDVLKNLKCSSNGVNIIYYTKTKPDKKLVIYNKNNTFYKIENVLNKII